MVQISIFNTVLRKKINKVGTIMNLNLLGIIQAIFSSKPDSFNVDVVDEVVEATGENKKVVANHVRIYQGLEALERARKEEKEK